MSSEIFKGLNLRGFQVGKQIRILLMFMVCVGAMHCLFTYLVWLRMRIAKTRREISLLRRQLGGLVSGE